MAFATSPCGARVSYSATGSGPALLLLHGAGGDSLTHWGSIPGALATTHRVICPDYAGSGKTVDNGSDLTVEMLADQIIAVMDAEQVIQADLVGYSFGAAIAAVIATRQPQRIRRLMLVAGFAHSCDSRLQLQLGLWQTLISHDINAMARLQLLTGAHPAWLMAQSSEALDKLARIIMNVTNWSGMARQVATIRALDIRPLLSQLSTSTWIVVGDQDQIIPRALSQELLESITCSQWHELPAGHLLPLEQPAALAALIAEFSAN